MTEQRQTVTPAPAVSVVMTNLLWSMMLVIGYTVQLVFTSMQQCYMPYGYMFSNESSYRESNKYYYQRKTNSIFEMLDLHDDIEMAAFAACQHTEDSIY